jgi:tripartite-type tricarboxylate transporter receptor subunit TctC
MRASHKIILTTALLLNASFCFGTASHADEPYPSRRVRVIVPFPPGSQTDLIARMIAGELSQKWQQTLYVDNVPGAAGAIGTVVAERSQADGYTLLVIPPSFVINPFVYKNAGPEPSKWAAVSLIVTAPYLLVARPNFPGTTTNDLVAQAKSTPNGVTFATGGVGSSAQLAAVQLEMMTGIKMLHVPFRGAAPALTAVMSSQVDMVFDALATTLPLWQAGKVKVLGIGTKTRSPVMPDVPTIEADVPGFEAVTWTAMVAPPSTPAPIVEKISAGVKAVLQEPSVIERLQTLKLDIAGTSPTEASAFLAKEAGHWGKIARDAGISAEQ